MVVGAKEMVATVGNLNWEEEFSFDEEDVDDFLLGLRGIEADIGVEGDGDWQPSEAMLVSTLKVKVEALLLFIIGFQQGCWNIWYIKFSFSEIDTEQSQVKRWQAL